MMNAPKVHIPAALRLGCLTGLLTACGPAFVCSLASHRLIHILRHWVLGWDGPDAELTIGGLLGGTTLKVSLDLQDHLNVTEFMKTLETLDSGWWWTIPLLTLALTALGGVLLAALSGTGAGLYSRMERRHWLASSSAPRPSAWLSLLADPTRRWPVCQGFTRVGSDPVSEVQLPSGMACHAEIRYEQGRYILYDLSGGQTWVQNRPVAGRHLLKDGFRLRFGNVEMIFKNE
jgi:hypothetical protein